VHLKLLFSRSIASYLGILKFQDTGAVRALEALRSRVYA